MTREDRSDDTDGISGSASPDRYRGAGRAFVLFVVAVTALAAGTRSVVAAQSYPAPPSVEQLARQADVVVIGDVTATAGEWDAERANIYTRVHVEAREVLKGFVPSPLSFTQLGGQVGDRMSAVAGAARFKTGERVLVFLARGPRGALRLSDLIHGKLQIEHDPTTGRDYAVRFSGAPAAERLPLDQVRAQVRHTLGG